MIDDPVPAALRIASLLERLGDQDHLQRWAAHLGVIELLARASGEAGLGAARG